MAGADMEKNTLEEWSRPHRQYPGRMLYSPSQSQGPTLDPLPPLVFVKRQSHKALSTLFIDGHVTCKELLKKQTNKQTNKKNPTNSAGSL